MTDREYILRNYRRLKARVATWPAYLRQVPTPRDLDLRRKRAAEEVPQHG